MRGIELKNVGVGLGVRFHLPPALWTGVAVPYLLASLAASMIGGALGSPAWGQIECPAGFHVEGGHISGGQIVGGHCVENPPSTAGTIFVDLQNSGAQDGTAAHPYRTLPQALAVAAAGDTIAIRTGAYSFQGASLVLNRAATLRADNGLVTIGALPVWVNTQTSEPTSQPAPYDLVTRAFDDNGIPLNPMLGSQIWSSPKLGEPLLCGGGNPWQPPCTAQTIMIDNNVDKCRLSEGPLKGHANWGLATYEGLIYWENHSYYLQDDDYSFALYRADHAGMTRFDVEKGFYQGYLHSGFDSDQTINRFHTWYWDILHQAVDADAGKGGVLGSWMDIKIPIPPYTKTRPIFDGKEAIVMGLYGLDCAHDCGAELHPVYALAIHLNENDKLDDDMWAIFVRNWGDEGYCSSGQERIEPDKPFSFSFRLKKPGAIQVSSIPAQASDSAGQHGTSFWGDSDQGGSGIQWFEPVLVPNEGAVVSFTLPPSSLNGRINGMLHLKWAVSASGAANKAESVPRPPSQLFVLNGPSEHEEAEGQTTARIQSLTAERKASLESAWESIQPARPAAIQLSPATAPRNAGANSAATPQVRLVPDKLRDAREQLLQEVAPPR